MKHRPWPIILLAALHLFMPAGNVLLSAWLQDMGPVEFMRLFFQTQSAFMIFDFMGVYFVAAFAIFTMKKWSYPVYVTAVAMNVYRVLYNWAIYGEPHNIFLFLGLTLVNVAVVSYFLLPKVRMSYFDSRLRWWERLPRYFLNCKAVVKVPEQGDVSCTISNLSEGGALILSTDSLTVGDVVKLEFELFQVQYAVKARVIRLQKANQKGSFGLQFSENSTQTAKQLKTLVKALKKMGVPNNQEKRHLMKDFTQWATRALKTGKGFLPEFQMPGDSVPSNVVSINKRKNESGKKVA